MSRRSLRPRDLPELRVRLLREWEPGGEFRKMAALPHDTRFLSDPRFSHLESGFDVHVLSQGRLWWIDETMSELVAHAASSLPPTTLTADLAPKHPVIAYFAKPLIGTDGALENHSFEVNVLAWKPHNRIRWTTEDLLTISMYGPSPIEEDWCPPTWPFGRTDWLYGTDTEVVTFPSRDDTDDRRRALSMEEDRRWLAALLLLTQQPMTAREVVRPNNSKRRRLQKAGDFDTDVTVVGLHPPEASDEPGVGVAGRQWGHRTIVGAHTGGFWKQVVYGPGRSLRRPQWIFPYEAGPKGAPLIIKDKVTTVRGGRKS